MSLYGQEFTELAKYKTFNIVVVIGSEVLAYDCNARRSSRSAPTSTRSRRTSDAMVRLNSDTYYDLPNQN
jgi:hypothetical protein